MDPHKDTQQIEKEIISIISEKLGITDDTLNRDVSLYDDLNASKLETADIIQTIEDKYQIKFTPEQLKNLETIGNILELVTDNVE